MTNARRPLARRGGLTVVAAAAAVLMMAGCTSSDPLNASGSPDASGPIVVGSQDYYSNEIIAEIYAQALEANGLEVERRFNIGSREVYLPTLESGEIDLFPEYTGNLLQYYDEATTARTTQDVYAALTEVLPAGLQVLDQAQATDQDSYVMTQAFSEANSITSLDDLASASTPITLGGNSELETRPYGPEGLLSTYGATVGFTAFEDNGGPLTLAALLDDTVQMANIFTADPNIATNSLVTLDDPKGLFLASHVVPLASAELSPEAIDVINTVQTALTAADLVALNSLSVNDQQATDVIAADWLAQKDLF